MSFSKVTTYGYKDLFFMNRCARVQEKCVRVCASRYLEERARERMREGYVEEREKERMREREKE